MDVRYAVGVNEYKRMTTPELRKTFLVDNLFNEGRLDLLYCETERVVLGSAVPAAGVLTLDGGKELASETFCKRRELGVLNLGAAGTVTVDGEAYDMEHLDGLYVGRGIKAIAFQSQHPANPAQFYLVSYPAHADYPTTQAKRADAEEIKLGSSAGCNERTIHQYIYQGGIQSCQLVMGFTRLKEGSVWNTMPAHTHERRTEVYLYFDVADDASVFHFMGSKEETRHIAVGDKQAVISPMWSIHSGCGTCHYSFAWAMGGENQRFDDMDGIAVRDIK